MYLLHWYNFLLLSEFCLTLTEIHNLQKVPLAINPTSHQHIIYSKNTWPYFPVRALPQDFSVTDNTTRSNVKKNYKTELCKHYIEWTATVDSQRQNFTCPYGERCNFAHGEAQLTKFANSYDMYEKGVIDDPDTYLCLPCFDHVATGSW